MSLTEAARRELGAAARVLAGKPFPAEAALMGNPGLEKHVAGTLSWAQWQLQRYLGL